MTMVAGFVQLLGTNAMIRKQVESAEVSITRGFMFASAVSIVAGVAQKHLSGCMAANMVATVVIFSASIAVGVGVPFVFERFEKLRSLAALGLPAAVMVAWGAFNTLESQYQGSLSRQCNRLGSGGLQWGAFTEHLPLALSWHETIQHVSSSAMVKSVIYGFLLGTVMLIESLTALEALTIGGQKSGGIHKSDWPRYMKVSAVVNVIAASIGLVCSTWSMSRSALLVQARANTRVASITHGLIIITLAVVAMPWMSKIPVLAIGVALTLVAIQMIDSKTMNVVWKPGYDANAKPKSLWGVWWFWLVLIISFFTEQAIYGLAVASFVFWAGGCLSQRLRPVSPI
jgi:MFS superfamily sulfate permease-like transporter